MQKNGITYYCIDPKVFPRIADLINYYVDTGTPVTHASGAILLTPISKYDKWSLRRNDIQIRKYISKGVFGDLYEAILANTGESVTVKMCQSDEPEVMNKFMQEADILKQYQHPNIIRLIGVCVEMKPFYLVLEQMSTDTLLDFLRIKGPQRTRKELCLMAIDVCKGMMYLAQNNCIHR